MVSTESVREPYKKTGAGDIASAVHVIGVLTFLESSLAFSFFKLVLYLEETCLVIRLVCVLYILCFIIILQRFKHF